MTEPVKPVPGSSARRFADATPPFLHQIPPEEGHRMVDAAQSDPATVLVAGTQGIGSPRGALRTN